MERTTEIAITAAKKAGILINERLGKVNNIDYKSAFNLVTEVDKAAEKLIVETLRGEYPDHDILGEEGGALSGKGEYRWFIDPIDGTTNYAHSYPFFCVSIGLMHKQDLVVGIVYNPVSDELFRAEKGNGAWLNDRKIQVSKITTLSESLLASGFPPDTRTIKMNNVAQFKTLTDISHGVRRDGSAALDLCFVAAGRSEGFWEMKLSPWDMAAGVLIVTEAGGKVTGLYGDPFDLNNGYILATNGLIHEEVVQLLTQLK